MSSQWDSQGQRDDSESSDQYPQTHHGPTQGQGDPPQQYPVPPPYGQAFGQYSQQPQQWTQNQSLYGNQYSYATPTANRSGALGIVGLIVVLAATITLIIVSWIGGQGFGQFILDTEASGLYTEEDVVNSPVTMEYVRSATGIVLGATLACLAGLTGWVISIVATVQRRGRGFGIAGIILGVLSLGFATAAFVLGIMPVLEYLG